MVPAPSGPHQRFGTQLLLLLAPLAEKKGLVASHETEVHRRGARGRDYRVPDIVLARPEACTERGVEGPCELVVEVLSPGDESREKLPFYEALGVREVLLVDPRTRAFELLALERGALAPVPPGRGGERRSGVLGASLRTVRGKLEIVWRGGKARI